MLLHEKDGHNLEKRSQFIIGEKTGCNPSQGYRSSCGGRGLGAPRDKSDGDDRRTQPGARVVFHFKFSLTHSC